MQEMIYIIISIFTAFVFGFIAMLLIGHKLSLNYLLVKMSKGKKILVFVKTKFGYVSRMGVKNENTIRWEHDKIKYITNIESANSVFRFGACDCIFLNLDKPEVCEKITLLTDGKELSLIQVPPSAYYPDDFDIGVYRNLLERAITRPTTDTQELDKKVMVVLIVVVILAFLIILIYFKQLDILKQVTKIGTGVVL
jgi:hypothetical protein